MSDMFRHYDNNINEKLSLKDNFCQPPVKMVRSNSNTEMVIDKLNREIGIKVKQGSAFTLYFYLDAPIGDTGEAYQKLKECNLVNFVIVSNKHEVLINKSFNFSDVFNEKASEIKLDIEQEDAEILKQDTYKMQLNLVFYNINLGEPSVCTIFDTSDGLLIVR